MMKACIVGLCCSMLSFSSLAQEKPGGTIHGLIVVDYFYKTGGDAQALGDSTTQYARIFKDFQAFQIRRLHFFYDYIISDDFATRFQLEGNNKSVDPIGRQSLYVKCAYGEWKNIFAGANLQAGLVLTPTWSSVEGIWGYRSVEKSIADMRGFGVASDMGLLLQGAIPTSLPLTYSLMIGNGTGQKQETNRYKKYYGTVGTALVKNLSLELYGDYEPYDNGKDRATWKAFMYYQAHAYMIGGELIQQIQRKQDSLNTDCAPFGASLYSWIQLKELWKLYARIDYYDPNSFGNTPRMVEYFASLGFDYTPVKDYHLMPNIWLNAFSDKSGQHLRKKTDVVPRLTFYFTFH